VIPGIQVLLDSLHPHSTGGGASGLLLQFSKGEAVKIYLESDSSGICAIWPNRDATLEQ